MSPDTAPVSLRPTNACAWCRRRVLHFAACFNNKAICTDCCGED